MPMSPTIAKPVVGVLLAASLQATAQVSSCEPLLTPALAQHPTVALAFRAWMCSTRFVSHQEFFDAGIAEGVEAYGQRLAIGGTFKPAARDAWKSTSCSPAMLGARPALATRTFLSTLPAAEVQRFANCRNASTTRLACTVVPGNRGTTLAVRWKGGESRPAGIRPQMLAVDVAGGAAREGATVGAPASSPAGDWVADVPLTIEACAGVAVVVETTFGFCAVPAYLPALQRRVESRLFESDTQGRPYVEVRSYGTKNLGHLVRHLQIQSMTVELSDRSGEITSVSYSCRNPVDFDRCPWSLNPDTDDTSANVVIAADRKSFTWKRRWNGDPVDDIYTVRYRVPREVCVENCECPAR